MRIDDPDNAAKLARALLADIEAYNEAKIAGARARGVAPSSVLAEEVAEARGLFLARVDRGLEPIFDQILGKALGGRPLRPPPGT